MDCCIFPVSIQHNIEALRVDLLCSPGSLSIRGTGSHVSTSFSILAVAYTSGLLALWWTCHRASSLHPNACLKSWPTLSSVSNVCLLSHGIFTQPQTIHGNQEPCYEPISLGFTLLQTVLMLKCHREHSFSWAKQFHTDRISHDVFRFSSCFFL